MNDNDLNKIREIAENHTFEPRSEAWGKLNQKLKSKRTKTKLIEYRNISIAAILISVLSITAVFKMYLTSHDPKVFASNEQFKPLILEELDMENSNPHYEIAATIALKKAYKDARVNIEF